MAKPISTAGAGPGSAAGLVVSAGKGARDRRLPALILVLLMAVAAAPRPALAGPGERVAYLNKKAMEDYDALEFESARKTLTDAVALLRKSAIDSTPQAARTYINLGMVYIALKDKSRGQQQFIKAQSINPKAKLDPTLATPEMQSVWDAASGGGSSPPTPVDPVTPPPVSKPPSDPLLNPGQPTQTPIQSGPGDPLTPPVKPTQPLEYNADELLDPVLKVELRHTPVDEARGGQKLNFYVTPNPLTPGAAAARVSLFYRGAGQSSFSEAPMSPSRRQQGDLLGQIPSESVSGKAIQYYIQAYDAKNRVCGNQGSPENPLIVRITSSGGPAVAQGSDLEDPIQYVKRADEERLLAQARDWVYFDVGIGTGGAIISAGTTSEVAYLYNNKQSKYVPAGATSGGFIWSGLGIRAEAGVYLWRGLSLGVSGRFEGYLNHNADSQANGFYSGAGCTDPMTSSPAPCYTTVSKGQFGYAVLGKLRYQFRKLPGNIFRPYIHLDVGGGSWRGALNLDGSRPQITPGVVDQNSAYNPTDQCSAEFNGNTSNRMPPGCSSRAGAGYNSQQSAAQAGTVVVPSRMNRVCPANGACIDSVILGNVLVGGGFGFYVGGRNVGLSVDLNLLAAIGDQNSFLIDTYVGPQFNF